MHIWGDDDFDWNALDSAIYYMWKNCRRYARLGIWTKEKYGTLRVIATCAFFNEYGAIHHLFYPGHVSYHWPIWFRKYVDRPVSKLLGKLGILSLVQRYQLFVLKHVWLRAAKKWPHIATEIMDEYDFYFGERQ